MTNDQPDFGPFQQFQPGQAIPGIFDSQQGPDPSSNGGAKRGRPRKGKRGRPRKVATEAAAPRERQPQGPRQIKIELGLALRALSGLTGDDTKFLTGVVQAMDPFPAQQKRRIAGALSVLFG